MSRELFEDFNDESYDDEDYKELHNHVVSKRIKGNSRKAKEVFKQYKDNKPVHLQREWSDK